MGKFLEKARAVLAFCLMTVVLLTSSGAVVAYSDAVDVSGFVHVHMSDMDVQAADIVPHCPSSRSQSEDHQRGHGTACAMSVCCFSTGEVGRASVLVSLSYHALFVISDEKRLTQEEPELAKKPPRIS